MNPSKIFPDIPAEAVTSIRREALWCAVVFSALVLYGNEYQSMFRFVRKGGQFLHLAIRFLALVAVYFWVELKVLHYLLIPKRMVLPISIVLPLIGTFTLLLMTLGYSFLERLGIAPFQRLLLHEWVPTPYGSAEADRWALTISVIQILFILINLVARRRLKPWSSQSQDQARPA